MSDDAARFTDPEGRFDFVLPPGWAAEPDAEQGGVEVWDDDGPGSLHLLGFATDEFADPGEELYAFLEDRGVELEEDEVEDLELADGGEMSLTEYASEDEEEGESLFWMVGVATAPGTLVFASYFCPAGQEEREREKVRGLLVSLRVREGE
ncbi:MAG TPA: hypothetical protein VFX98_06230 [Longimicrobiaceae bacterium]|nr:hypothetical protein [Longimicrobiaceae bacterium]